MFQLPVCAVSKVLPAPSVCAPPLSFCLCMPLPRPCLHPLWTLLSSVSPTSIHSQLSLHHLLHMLLLLPCRPQGQPAFQYGTTDDRPVLPVEPEVFVLRKLLPASDEYDFNIHVMDFEPGQYLYVKEIHYNQHGLLLLQGQGIYRLANNW